MATVTSTPKTIVDAARCLAPELSERVEGCVFAPRCRFARPECGSVSMELEPLGPGRASACPVRPLAGGCADPQSRAETSA